MNEQYPDNPQLASNSGISFFFNNDWIISYVSAWVLSSAVFAFYASGAQTRVNPDFSLLLLFTTASWQLMYRLRSWVSDTQQVKAL